MKKLLVLTMFILGISCQQNNPQPTPATPPPAVNTPSNPALTSQEQALVGNWILDKVETYTSSNLANTVLHTDPANCHLDLMSTFFYPGNGTSYKNSVNGITCSPVSGMWRIQNNLLELGASYIIYSVTPNSLILQYGSLTTLGHLYYFHK